MGTLFAMGVLQEHDRIVLADFVDQAGDSQLVMAITTAFSTDLEQSNVMNIASRDLVARVLGRMEVDPETPLDYDLAREVAIREGLKAVISGEVTAVGTGYLISARLSAAESGELLWSESSEVANQEMATILGAIQRLSRSLRSKIGESLAAVRASPPLSRVTTSSLEALKKYSLATRYPYVIGKLERMIEPLEEAIALDSTFASAWLMLGWAQEQYPYPKSEYVHSFTRAWELRDRVGERERNHIEYVYHWFVTEDEERIVAALQASLERDPQDLGALNDLGLKYIHWRRFEEAESLLRRCVEADSLNSTIPYLLLAQAQAGQGKWETTDTTLRRGSELHGAGTTMRRRSYSRN
jgi:tetratricopeptide (TPR) repeat protein